MSKQPSAAFQGALAQAYRRACLAGIPEVGTDLVLKHVAIYFPPFNELVPHPFTKAWRPVRKGTTGLTDPQPEPGLREVLLDEETSFEATSTLRRAAYAGADVLRVPYRRKRLPLPTFSPAVRYAVHAAIQEASQRGVEHAGPQHLLPPLLRVPGSAAARLLAQWRVPSDLLDRIAQGNLRYAGEDTTHVQPPASWAVIHMTMWRVLPTAEPRLWRGPFRAAEWLLGGVLFRRPYRRHGARYGHAILFAIESDAKFKAMQTGHDKVTATDVLLSVVDLHEQLTSAGKPLPAEVARWNQAGVILSSHGVQARQAAQLSARLESAPGDAEDNLADLPIRGWWKPKSILGSPSQGRTALAALRKASLSAHRLGHPYAGTTHLLIALLEEPHGPAARLLRQLSVDPDTIRSEATDRLENVASPPPPSPDDEQR